MLARHGDDVNAADLMDVRNFYYSTFSLLCSQHFENLMEGVQENEPNTMELKVDSKMTKDEVVAKIFEKIQKMSC